MGYIGNVKVEGDSHEMRVRRNGSIDVNVLGTSGTVDVSGSAVSISGCACVVSQLGAPTPIQFNASGTSGTMMSDTDTQGARGISFANRGPNEAFIHFGSGNATTGTSFPLAAGEKWEAPATVVASGVVVKAVTAAGNSADLRAFVWK